MAADWAPTSGAASAVFGRVPLMRSGARVVSMPCWELFAAQPKAYRDSVLGRCPRVAVEAAIGMGWERWLGDNGTFIGMEGFGASAPRGATLIDMSTVSPTISAEVANKLPAGMAYLRAPVSGSTAMASAGTLTALVSGPEQAFTAMTPIFAAFTKKAFHLGAGEEARVLKLVINSLVAATSALLGEALAVVSRDFASFERRPVKTITLPEEPEMTTPRTAIKRMNVQSALLTMAWPSIRLTDPDLYALDVLSFVLTEGESSRLVRALVREQQLAYSVESYSWTPEWARGLFVVSARLDPKNIEPARAAIWTEIRRLQADLIPEEELAQAKRQKTAEHVFGHQTAEQIAEAMAQDFMATGDAHFSDSYVARIQEVTEDQVRDAARRYLRPERTGTQMVLPRGEAVSETQNTAEPTSPARKIVLDNGLRVVLRRDSSSPLVAMQMYCLGGLVTEDASNNGISNLMAQLLLRGTSQRSAEQIARFFDSRGARIDAGSGNNTFYVRCEVLKEDFDEAMEVFADVVQHPTFPAEELERVRPRVLDAISRIGESWRTELEAYFRSRFFVKSPYRMLSIGSAEAIRRIDTAALSAYFRRFAVGPHAVLAIFGDIDEAKTEEAVRRLFGRMPAKAGAPRPLVPGDPPIERETLFVRKAPPERKVAGIYVGFRGMDVANTRDRYPMAVLETVMGGYMYPGGWLHEALRGGDRDLVYEVHDLNFVGVEPGYFGIYAACQPEKVGEVYRIIADKIDRARSGRFDEEELKQAKGIIIATDLMQSRTNSERASEAATDELYGLGFDHRREYAKYIESVTADDVRRVAKQYLTKPIVVVVTPDPQAVQIGVPPTAVEENDKPSATGSGDASR